MCGIFGIGLLSSIDTNAAVLRCILKKLASNAQERGSDATGYAFTSKNKVTIFKHNVSANEFIKLYNYKKTVRDNLSSKHLPYSVIGHTRQQTQGSHKNTDNNHPIKTGSVVGVHNGVINNDKQLFAEMSDITNGRIKRIGEVDSEIIFRLIDHYSDVHKFSFKAVPKQTINNNPTSKAIVRMAERISGGFACASVDSQNPKILWIFRGFNPVSVNYYKKEGVIVFGSTEEIVSSAVNMFDFSDPINLDVATNCGMCINLTDEVYNTFKLKRDNIL